MVLMLESLYDVFVTMIGYPQNDAQALILYMCLVSVGLYVFFMILNLFFMPIRMLSNVFK